ncbi:MAG TPA: hypothetical protein VH165_29325 [Kofleriaceae bacterium]|jgi:hypothetical protein|nr:hypothetical protein [Kofleriaceae bacterium]
MKTSQITPLLLGLLVLPTCGGDDGGATGNPKLLWLAPDMAETRVKLTGTEPPPF